MANEINPNSAVNDGSKKIIKEPDLIIMDLPEVSDIPGQENVELPEPHELGDPTIASADEEGDDIFERGENADLT